MAWPSSPDLSNVRFSPFLQSRMDVYRQGSTDTGGNVGLVFIHGGGWNGNDKTLVTDPAQNGYDLADYVLTTGLTGMRWNLVSIDYRMWAYTGGVKMSYPSVVFDGFDDVAAAVQHIKDNARLYGTDPSADSRSYGINPSKIVLFGSSAGATDALVVAFRRSRKHYASAPFFLKRFDYRSSSVPALVINYLGVIDVRFDAALGVETWPYDKFPTLFGTSLTDGGTEWGAVHPDIKAAASPLAFLEAPTMDARPSGVYSIYQATAPESKPYANIHTSEQAAIIDAALAAKQIDRATEVVASGTWKDYTPTPPASPSYALSARVVAFCEARLAV